jgi:uncharacterized membrane protein HdeD (DUF308 family)
MSDVTADSRPHGLGYAPITHKWGWFVALGIGLILAGMFAFADTVAFTLISVIFIGASFLVGGLFQVIHAIMTKGWKDFALNLFCGLITIAGGFLIMMEPVQGSLIITMFLAAALVVGGLLRLVMAVRHRQVKYWWLMAIGGLISAGLGVLIYMTLPWSSLTLLGTLVGIELVIQGMTWLQFGLALRRHRTA